MIEAGNDAIQLLLLLLYLINWTVYYYNLTVFIACVVGCSCCSILALVETW